MLYIISILLFAIFGLLSIIHVYWAFGGKWGSGAVFPAKDNKSKAIMAGFLPTIIVAGGLFTMGLFVLVKSTLISLDLPDWMYKYGLWCIASIFLARGLGDFRYVGIFKKVKDSSFGISDTKYYTPLCFLIAILTILLSILN